MVLVPNCEEFRVSVWKLGVPLDPGSVSSVALFMPVPVVANEGDGQQHPELVTLSVHVAFFDLIARQVAAYEPDDLTGIEVDVCGMRQFAQRTMLEMLPRKTRNPAERLVHSQKTPVHVDERHADRRVGERMLERMHH